MSKNAQSTQFTQRELEDIHLALRAHIRFLGTWVKTPANAAAIRHLRTLRAKVQKVQGK